MMTTMDYTERFGLQVATPLARFIEESALPGTGMDADAFWKGTRAIFDHLTPRNRELLAIRDEMQKKIDDWHLARKGQPLDMEEYEAFLRAIGYLRPEPAPRSEEHTSDLQSLMRIAYAVF